jgi:hypothetical protein
VPNKEHEIIVLLNNEDKIIVKTLIKIEKTTLPPQDTNKIMKIT